MKRFVWRLQQVLDIKAREEQARRSELLKLTERLAETRRRLLDARKILRDIILRIARQQRRQRLGEQEFFMKYSAASDEQIRGLMDDVSRLESQQRLKVAELLEVKRFREGLERLRAEAKRQFMAEQERLEQKEMDEGATMTFAREASGVLG